MSERIFVSSSQKDLRIYRDAIQETIMKMHLDPVVMEYFPAERRSGTDASLAYVRESDIFLLVLGWRYGEPPPNRQVSVTEMEYETALSIPTLPIIVYLAHQDTRAEPEKFEFDRSGINTNEPTDFSRMLSTKLEAFRGRVQKSHVCKYFTSSVQLRQMVSEDIFVTIQRGVKGNRLLADAQNKILQRDFLTSTQRAEEALRSLPPGSETSEVIFVEAQARFVLAMSILKGQSIHALSLPDFKQIESLMDQAITLQKSRRSYYVILSDLCREFGKGMFTSYIRKAEQLLQGAPMTDDDTDQLNYRMYQVAHA